MRKLIIEKALKRIEEANLAYKQKEKAHAIAHLMQEKGLQIMVDEEDIIVCTTKSIATIH